MTNLERLQDRPQDVAAAEFEAETTIMHHAWCAFVWLWCPWHEDRLEYLRELDRRSIGTAALGKEIRRIERARAKEAGR